MKKTILILVIFLLNSCFGNNKDVNHLVLPPNFTDLPDPANPEKISEKQKDEDVERLKDLLLKSE